MSAVHVVWCRDSVKWLHLAPAGIRILGAIDRTAQQCGLDLVITCGTEGHPLGDPHTLGEAVDVSVKEMDVPTLLAVRDFLQLTLGPLFTVLYECPALPTDPRLQGIVYVNAQATAPHFHLQRKKGTLFPPPAKAVVATTPTPS